MLCERTYAEDLAYIHDVGFGDFARNSAPELLKIFQQNSITEGLVVDLGCGSGIWAEILLASGYEVLGIDISGAMLKLARQKAAQAHFYQGSLFKAEIPQCVAITAIGECLNYQFDKHNFNELIDLFERIYKTLLPKGVFIFDVAEPGYVTSPYPERSYAEGEDWAILVEKQEDRQSHQLTRRMSIFRKVGELYRRSEETHHVQLYHRSELITELQKIGFKVEAHQGYGDYKFSRAQVGLIAIKD